MATPMFPVRVLVETVRPQHCLTCAHDGQLVADTFAIISGETQLNNMVDTVLSALGMPQLISESRGLIQINNWKPLPFETITDNQEELAANLFKEISNNITLKILTRHGSVDAHTQCLTQLKDRILKLAVEKQPQFLSLVDNQEIKSIVQQVIAGIDVTLSESQIQAINEWMDHLTDSSNDRKSPLSNYRFSHISEVPKLERWFKSDSNPSRQKLMSYMNTLNNGQYRKSNPKVTYQQICNWFSTQRAAAREANKDRENNSVAALATAVQQMANGQGMPSSFNWPGTTAQFAAMLQNTFGQTLNFPSPTTASTPTPPASTMTNSNNTTQIPLSTQPMDIRSKFNGANAYNPLMDRTDSEVIPSDASEYFAKFQRIDGGSESPTGNDDVSEHSASENCGFDADIKESMISSPDLSVDLNAFSPQQNSQQLANQNAAAAAVAALQSLVPMSMVNGGLTGFQLADSTSNTLAQLAASHVSSTPSSFTSSAHHNHHHNGSSGPNNSSNSSQNNTARSRLMFDPLSELPILESWFEENPHPGWLQIEQYTDNLNARQYRQNYPPISTHNVKIWFKNRRAKCKRLLTNDQGTPGKIALSAN